jgi:hypothetical protein
MRRHLRFESHREQKTTAAAVVVYCLAVTENLLPLFVSRKARIRHT